MFRQLAKKRSSSLIEFAVLVTLLLAAFVLFGKYVYRGLTGRWRATGESMGSHGIRYDPRRTIQCEYDYIYTNRWYNLECFEQKCDCSTIRQSEATCRTCILFNCTTPHCDG